MGEKLIHNITYLLVRAQIGGGWSGCVMWKESPPPPPFAF